MSNGHIHWCTLQTLELLKDKMITLFADYANEIILKPNNTIPPELAAKLRELSKRQIQELTKTMMQHPTATITGPMPNYMPFSGVSARCIIVDELKDTIKQHEEAEKLKLSKILDRDTLFRFAYVPFVIAELVWDYADTILTLSAMMRTGAKKLCRAVRELRRDYERERAQFIDQTHKDSEVENMYVFEDGVKDIYTQMLVNVRCDLKSEYPSLDKDSIDLLTAVYQCDITLQSLILYTQQQTAKIERIVGHQIGKILPAQIYKLARLIPEFVGDKPASENFNKLKKQYEKTFATQIALIELSDTLE